MSNENLNKITDQQNQSYARTFTIPILHTGGNDISKSITVWTLLGRKFHHERQKKHRAFLMIECQWVQKGVCQ